MGEGFLIVIAQGAEPRRSGAFSGRFTEYRKKTKTYRPGVDFRSYRGNVETTLRNVSDVNAGWVDELIGHDFPIRRSEGAPYTKSISMANVNTPPPEGGGFGLRLEAGLIDPLGRFSQTTLKLSSGSSGF